MRVVFPKWVVESKAYFSIMAYFYMLIYLRVVDIYTCLRMLPVRKQLEGVNAIYEKAE